MNYKNIEWKNYHGALLPKTAPHIKIDLTSQEQNELLKLSNAYFLRYISNWDMEQESAFWYVIKDSQEDLMSYKKNHRNQIKKGLKNCIVKKVSNNIIASEGYKVYKKAFLNYATGELLITKINFKKSILNSKESDFWVIRKNIIINSWVYVYFKQEATNIKIKLWLHKSNFQQPDDIRKLARFIRLKD